jgi:NADH-quinone oxidoreductase subunit L
VLGLDGIFGAHRLTDFLEASVVNAHAAEFQPLIAITALALGLAAIFLSWRIYGGGHAVTANRRDPLAVNPNTGAIWRLANAKLYWDETYFRLIENPYNRIAHFLANTVDWRFLHDYFHDVVLVRGFNALGLLLSRPIDLGIVDGAVNGIGRLVRWCARQLRRVQTGYVRTYAISFLLGVVLVLVILLLPMLQQG